MFARHFTRKEFECQCGCGMDSVDSELVNVLDDVRDYLGVPVFVTSGNRCKKHNKEIGGSDDSQHLYSKAADFKAPGFSDDLIADYLEKRYPDKYGIGRYKGRTHIDVRPDRARWDNR